MFNLLYRNLIAVYLYWAGWLEEYGMIISMKVGFVYTDVFQPAGVLWMVMSRYLNLLSVSVSAVNFRLGCIVLKLWISVWLES